MMQFSRRNFLKTGAAGLALASMPSIVCAASAKPQVGVQLYSVRKLCEKDLVGTLKAIKEMGYAGVEFAGYYGKSAQELKKMLDDNGLVACGTHTGLDTIKPENLAKTIEFNQTIGNKYLMVPGMKVENTAQGWIDTAKLFSGAAVTAKAAGMVVGYHNHQHEFKDKFDGKCKWDIFFSNASADVCSQMDVGHVVSAGEDPVAWLKKFPKRSRTLHAKEIYPGPGILGQVPEGKQGVKWDEVFAATDADAVTDWYIVESEADPNTLEKIRGCIDFLKSKGRA
ncbi:MAG TPA: TIM barrel protein [Kiritimatiellia bacterium]|nr:TIM barrel protein [Kiritimatiellia bacterium]